MDDTELLVKIGELSTAKLIKGAPLHWAPLAITVTPDTLLGNDTEPVAAPLLTSCMALPPEAAVSVTILPPVGKLICSASRLAITAPAANERMIKKPITPKARIKIASCGREKLDGLRNLASPLFFTGLFCISIVSSVFLRLLGTLSSFLMVNYGRLCFGVKQFSL